MYILWTIVSAILGTIWLIVAVAGTGTYFVDGPEAREANAEEFKIFTAVMAGLLIVVLFHWIVVLLAVPAFFCYGAWQGLKLLFRRKRVDSA